MGLRQEDFRCPVTKGPLAFVARDDLVPRLAEAPPETVSGAFLSEQAGLAYPIDDGIHVFLEVEALPLKTGAKHGAALPGNDSVRTFYDTFGWQRNEQGVLHDSALFSFQDQTPAKRYEVLSHLATIERLGPGELLLDAGCGATAHREHAAYQLFFQGRVCLDFSRTGLREARKHLGDAAAYVLADICHMPFRDGLFDAGVSNYVFMHIDEADQETALQEILRVARPGGRVVICNPNPRPGRNPLRLPLVAMARLFGRSGRWVRPHAEDAPPLYAMIRTRRWWKQAVRRAGARARIESLRVFNMTEATKYFGRSPRFARAMRGLEAFLPRLLAPVSKYIVIEIEKPGGTGA